MFYIIHNVYIKEFGSIPTIHNMVLSTSQDKQIPPDKSHFDRMIKTVEARYVTSARCSDTADTDLMDRNTILKLALVVTIRDLGQCHLFRSPEGIIVELTKASRSNHVPLIKVSEGFTWLTVH